MAQKRAVYFSLRICQAPAPRPRIVLHSQGVSHTKVTGYEQMVERTEALWREGLNDTQLTQEGFRTARSTGVAPWAVYMIRLEHGWHLFLARSWRALELDGYLTALGLAEKLGVNRE
jgi:hypothetical protein